MIRYRALVTAALAAAALGLSPSGPEGPAAAAGPRSEAPMSPWFVTYKRPMAPPGALSQVITREHGCVLHVSGPMVGVDLPERSEIGRYRGTCAPGEADRLKELASVAAAEAAAAEDVASPRGTRFLTFGVGQIGKDLDTLAAFPLSAPLPPGLQRLDEAVLALARRLLEHPEATLRGAAVCDTSALEPGQELSLTLALRNSGSSPIRIRNPAAGEDEAEIGLTLVLEEDLPAEQMDEADSVFIPLRRGEVIALPAPGSSGPGDSSPFVKLEPGAEHRLSLRVRRHLYLGRGRYRAAVLYTGSTEGVSEREAVEGTLRAPAGQVAVGARH